MTITPVDDHHDDHHNDHDHDHQSTTLVPHGDHFDRVPVNNGGFGGNFGGFNFGVWGRKLMSMAPRSLLSDNHHREVVEVVVVRPERYHHHRLECGLVSIGCWSRRLMGSRA
jgi:hypothetical protein